MSCFKKIMAVCLVVICAVMLFGCGDENVDKTDESVVTTASVSATEESVTDIKINESKSEVESESAESGEALVMPTYDNGNIVEIITMPKTEIAEGETVAEAETAGAESATEINSEPADETQPKTVIELPFVPAG